MDFSKLSSADKQIVYAAGAVVLLAIVALVRAWGGLVFLPLLGGLGALAVVFMPQMSPTTRLPGSRGSLLLICGGVAGVFWLLATLTWLDYIFSFLATFDTILFLLGLAASLWLAWLSWQAFQGEGGKFVIGAQDSGASGTTAASAPQTSPPPAEPMSPPPAEPMSPSQPMAAPSQPEPPREPMAPSEPMAQSGPSEPMAPRQPTTSTEDDERA